MEKERINVLLVEDDEEDAFIVRRLLQKARAVECELTWEKTLQDGLDALCAGAFHVGLVDYRLGARDGLDLLRQARARDVRTPLILLTGQDGRALDARALEAGAADYLTKSGLDAEALERSIRYAHERARSEQAIRHQAALLDEAHDAICAYNLDGTVAYWNRRAEEITGYTQEEVGSVRSGDCLYGVDHTSSSRAWKTTLEEGAWTGELEQQTKSGDTITLKSRWTLVRDEAGEPQRILVINTDITERKRLETQALRAHRMESVGRLASGIAHDLGNLLAPIQLGVSVLQERHTEDERTQRTLQMIDKSARRGAEMVKRVLAFARGVDGERIALPLGEVFAEVERLVKETFPDDIAFEKELPADLPSVQGDATQLQQVLVNLSVNARDAMPAGGRLLLAARHVSLAAGDARLTPDAAPGEYVHVCVSDTGTGIAPEVIGEVFEPFFSTKAEEGTGLGLSTVYSIVKSHGGFVDVQSEEDAGTAFDVFLPVAGNKERAEPETPRVLVLDDDAAIRKTITKILEGSGYRPVTAASADEAQHLFEDRTVEAVLTDVALPGTDGLQVIRSFKERRPEVPVVVCSGRRDSQIREVRHAGADHFLPKPFDAAALCEALEAVLSSSHESAAGE